MKKFSLIFSLLILATALGFVSCSSDDDSDSNETIVTLVSTSPANGETGVANGTIVTLKFSGEVSINNSAKSYSVNGVAKSVMELKKSGSEVSLSAFEIETGVTYQIVIPAGTFNEYDSEISFSFSGADKIVTPKEKSVTLVNGNQNAQKLYDKLWSFYGKKIISGTMADVSVNQNEAKLVKAATGKTPMMQTFDFCFVTLTSDRSTWEQNSIYQDITYYQNLYNQGGIVSACWHLNVPSKEAYAAKNDVNNSEKAWNAKVYFSAKNAVKDGTWENEFLKFSFDKATEVLLKYKNAGIPVVWRPFHEASGNAEISGKNSDAWFWWGKDGAEAYKELWIYMFNYFKNKGLDNLIWVWTTQIGVGSDGSEKWYCSDDYKWYPGDDYVDIVARDNYNKSKVESSVQEFETIQFFWPNKMITLGENGGIAKISEIFAAGGKFLYFMPWYTFGLSDLNKSDHAKTDWWQDAANCSEVLFLEDL
ncbi:MAG: Ig-like domain-containing protein [Bacteroidales bacterium]|nr:Ig-like domain-containing protein [Bacteroidales bacterium]